MTYALSLGALIEGGVRNNNNNNDNKDNNNNKLNSNAG